MFGWAPLQTRNKTNPVLKAIEKLGSILKCFLTQGLPLSAIFAKKLPS